MNIERAVQLLEIEKECIRRSADCNRDCARCELVQDGAELSEAYDTAIATLHKAVSDEYVKIPETGIGDLSDGYHTFNGLYRQRMVLFAAMVKAYKDRAWKSLRHEDGEPCFGGGWFIVGIDTPEGSYTYHYETKDWFAFDCVELPVGKHWDGHTEDDVTRLLSLSLPVPLEWVSCKEQLPDVGETVLTYTKWGHVGDRELRQFLDGTLLFRPDGLKPGIDVLYWAAYATPGKGKADERIH